MLPGARRPCFLERGEGRRFLPGTFLATTIRRGQDTGSLLEGTILSGARNFVVPFHRQDGSHEAIYVLKGVLLDDEELSIEGGDYASVPSHATQHEVLYSPDQASDMDLR